MKLAQLLRNAPTFTSLRETYTSRSEEQIAILLETMYEHLQAAVSEYVDAQDYPKYSVEVFRPRQLVRVPEHIRAMAIDLVDDHLEDHEVLLKFDLYMTLCTSVGDNVQEMYAIRYRKIMDKLEKKQPIPNIKNN
jgi:predicted transcriptional regulator